MTLFKFERSENIKQCRRASQGEPFRGESEKRNRLIAVILVDLRVKRSVTEWGDQDLSSGTKWKNIKSQSYFSADALGTDVVFDYSLLFNYWQSQTRI